MHRAPDCRISRLWVSTYHSGVGSLTESSKRGLPLSAVASTPSTATNLRTYFGETPRNVIAPLLPHDRGPESQEIEGCKPEGKGGQETHSHDSLPDPVPRRRAYIRRILARLPQPSMLHHLRLLFLLVS
jgi:hypothetical protein